MVLPVLSIPSGDSAPNLWKRPSTPTQLGEKKAAQPAPTAHDMKLLASMKSMTPIERKELLKMLLKRKSKSENKNTENMSRKRPNSSKHTPVSKRTRGTQGMPNLQLVVCDFTREDIRKLEKTSPSKSRTPLDNRIVRTFRVPSKTLSPSKSEALACLEGICKSAMQLPMSSTQPLFDDPLSVPGFVEPIPCNGPACADLGFPELLNDFQW